MIPKHPKLETGPEWMDLKAIQKYASVSERTVRDWINRLDNPLPASRVEGGKILIKRSKFDSWLECQPYRSDEAVDINRIVNEVLSDRQRVN